MRDHHIAGWKTAEDWIALREQLTSAPTKELWRKAFDEFFMERIRLRYLDPITTLQENSTFKGEGFSIMAIICSLVEFLESTYRGKLYRYLQRGETLGENEYSSSKAMFCSFLINRKPFSDFFGESLAKEFYENVRCGLLHEASTKGGWRIWAKGGGFALVDGDKKIVYRDNFQDALLQYVSLYGKELEANAVLQAAFIRKFDSL